MLSRRYSWSTRPPPGCDGSASSSTSACGSTRSATSARAPSRRTRAARCGACAIVDGTACARRRSSCASACARYAQRNVYVHLPATSTTNSSGCLSVGAARLSCWYSHTLVSLKLPGSIVRNEPRRSARMRWYDERQLRILRTSKRATTSVGSGVSSSSIVLFRRAPSLLAAARRGGGGAQERERNERETAAREERDPERSARARGERSASPCLVARAARASEV